MKSLNVMSNPNSLRFYREQINKIKENCISIIFEKLCGGKKYNPVCNLVVSNPIPGGRNCMEIRDINLIADSVVVWGKEYFPFEGGGVENYEDPYLLSLFYVEDVALILQNGFIE